MTTFIFAMPNFHVTTPSGHRARSLVYLRRNKNEFTQRTFLWTGRSFSLSTTLHRPTGQSESGQALGLGKTLNQIQQRAHTKHGPQVYESKWTTRFLEQFTLDQTKAEHSILTQAAQTECKAWWSGDGTAADLDILHWSSCRCLEQSGSHSRTMLPTEVCSN